MKRKALLTTVILTTLLILAAAGVSTARADHVVTTDAIAGTWYGNMHFSGANSVQRIELTILAGLYTWKCVRNPGELSDSMHLGSHV